MKSLAFVLCIGFLAFVLPQRGRAELLAYDGFEDYTAGVQVESGANGSAGRVSMAGLAGAALTT